jgi:uncharacterized protein YkwD
MGAGSKLTEKLYLPDIEKDRVTDIQTVQDILFRLIRDSPYQQRNVEAMVRHSLLDQAAHAKAADMAQKKYFSHTSLEGVTANENVRKTGYFLPDWYPVKGNNVESLYLGFTNPDEAVKSWYKSDFHRVHVFGEAEFFRNQNCVGIGVAKVSGEDRYYYVFISAVCT